LKSHQRTHRGPRVPQDGRPGPPAAWPEPKPFQCAGCEKRFRDEGIMLAHQRTHAEQGPQPGWAQGCGAPQKLPPAAPQAARGPRACGDCGKAFTQGRCLQLHHT
ncbi:ZN501 protein, partial [Asarcornis scutulata]|nr:ZN501 protein [Asarcornis scutulata]